MTPGLLNLAEKEATKLATIVIKNSISTELLNTLNTKDLFLITNNTVDINNSIINIFTKEATIEIQKNLKHLEEGNIEKISFKEEVLADYDKDNLKKGIFQRISSGIVFNNPLLISLSPKIPIKFTLIGNTQSNIDTKVTNYGINNALVQVNLNISVNIQVLLPVTSKEITVNTEIPVVTKLINGVTPSYYFTNPHTYTLPN